MSGSDEKKISEANRILDAATSKGVVLRLIGGLAIRNHCVITFFCGREYVDIDFVGLSRQIRDISDLFRSLGYRENESLWFSSAGHQMQFYHSDIAEHVDVFLDMLRMDHDLKLKNRLSIEAKTISVSDLLVSKLLIYKLNEKDVRDILTLIKDLTLGEDDRSGVINVRRIAELGSDGWGLYVDIMANIEKCIEHIGEYNLTAKEISTVKSRMLRIKKAVDKEPKTLRWKIRKLLGESIPLRRTVEDQIIT